VLINRPNRLVLLILQVGYVWHLFSSTADWVNQAANVGSHFIINNVLQSAFILLWVRSRFWIAELMLVINFFNLMSLYFSHSTPVLLIQIPVISGPLAWTFVALFWDGAAMVGAHSLPARILANVAIWMILVFGTFFLAFFKDWAMGFELSILSACKSFRSTVRAILVEAIACLGAVKITLDCTLQRGVC